MLGRNNTEGGINAETEGTSTLSSLLAVTSDTTRGDSTQVGRVCERSWIKGGWAMKCVTLSMAVVPVLSALLLFGTGTLNARDADDASLIVVAAQTAKPQC